MKLFRLARPVDGIGVRAGRQPSMVAHQTSAREPINGQLMHGLGDPFKPGALGE